MEIRHWGDFSDPSESLGIFHYKACNYKLQNSNIFSFLLRVWVVEHLKGACNK